MSDAHAASESRRLSKRVANAAHGKKHRVEKSKKLKKPLCTVDFAKLEMSSLLKYKRHFKLPLRPAAPKVELIAHIRKHFVHHPRIRDVDVISAFLYANQQQKLQNKQALQQAAAQQQEQKSQQAAAAAAAAAAPAR